MAFRDKVGPMGWWVHPAYADYPEKTLKVERETFERLEAVQPIRFSRRMAKPKDPAWMQKILSSLKSQGWEDGFCFTELEKIAVAKRSDWIAQIIGSCVASGHIRVIGMRSLAEVVILGDPEGRLGDSTAGLESLYPFGPYSYRVGRAAAGIGGNGDGSTCGGQISGTMKHGFLPCDTPGIDSNRYPEPSSGSIYRSWGANDSRVSKFYAAAEKFDLVESERMETVEDVHRAIMEDLTPVQICSGWGLGPAGRHKDGFSIYKRRGSWAHNLSLTARRKTRTRDWFTKVTNTWGPNAHEDGEFFMVPDDVLASWLKSAYARNIGYLVLREASVPPKW